MGTLALALEGHEFIARRCRRYHSDLFETRLLGARTVCMLGEDAARVFCDRDRFARARAMPARSGGPSPARAACRASTARRTAPARGCCCR